MLILCHIDEGGGRGREDGEGRGQRRRKAGRELGEEGRGGERGRVLGEEGRGVAVVEERREEKRRYSKRGMNRG